MSITMPNNSSRKAVISGWIGSVLEYYDFFIYATAAIFIFPQIFFPSIDPHAAIIASLSAYGVGYISRPLGAIILGHFGDTHGRKNVLLWCLFLMGGSTVGVGLLPTYDQIGLLAPVLLVILRLLQGFAVAGEISGASTMILEHAPFDRRGYYASFTLQGVQAGQVFAAAVFLPLIIYMPPDQFQNWGWRIPFLLSFFVIVAGWVIRKKVEETPVFSEIKRSKTIDNAPIIHSFINNYPDMLRVICMALMNVIPAVTTIFGATYAVQTAYGIGIDKDIYLWIPVVGNVVAILVIPCVGKLSDRVGRRPPIVFGALASGALSFAYLYFISTKNIPAIFFISVLMWGVVYQGYNAVFPSFYSELFPGRTRVSSMSIAQNVGTAITAMLPAIFAIVAPPGTSNIWIIIGSIVFGITVVVAFVAINTRETYRLNIQDA